MSSKQSAVSGKSTRSVLTTAHCSPLTANCSLAFSLIELLTVMAVAGILFAALSAFTRVSLNTTAAVQDKSVAEQTARAALARLAREASLAKIISAADQYHIAFTAPDLTGDGADDSLEYRWTPATNTLTRTLNGAAETLASNVALFTLDYQYETESSTTIVAPGGTLPVTLGSFAGVGPGPGITTTDIEQDVQLLNTVYQYFTNLADVPAATSVTLRARTKVLPPGDDMYVALVDSYGHTVACAILRRSRLTTTFQDVTIPLSWIAPPGTRMVPGAAYCLLMRPATLVSLLYAGTLLLQDVSGTTLPNGLRFTGGSFSNDNTASLYFSVSGNITITTPHRSTTQASVFKTVRPAIRVVQGGQTVELTGTFKVLNQ